MREKITLKSGNSHGHRGHKKPFKSKAPRGSHEKATLSHESRLKKMLNQTIELLPLSAEGMITGTLVGYDAFTITVDIQGVERTYFKHSLESFAPVELH